MSSRPAWVTYRGPVWRKIGVRGERERENRRLAWNSGILPFHGPPRPPWPEVSVGVYWVSLAMCYISGHPSTAEAGGWNVPGQVSKGPMAQG